MLHFGFYDKALLFHQRPQYDDTTSCLFWSGWKEGGLVGFLRLSSSSSSSSSFASEILVALPGLGPGFCFMPCVSHDYYVCPTASHPSAVEWGRQTMYLRFKPQFEWFPVSAE
ncbi:hypothetical protein TgHK011_006363 [Trichoderma gracile]|nr:hypothetical protein TgHK011_006363 [Trichoderma gracile]